MSRRRRGQTSQTDLAQDTPDPVQDDDQDDQLARELEQERQKLLAETAEASGSQTEEDEQQQDEEVLPDDDEEDLVEEEEDNSEDEWQPPASTSRSRSTRQSKRRRPHPSSEDSDDASQHSSQSDEEPVSKKHRKTVTTKQAKTKRATHQREQTTDGQAEQEAAYDSFDEEAERVQAEVEAAAAWADVRRRKETGAAPPSTNGKTSAPTPQPPSAAPSLTAWLGKGPSASSSVSELAASLPMPTTCTSAQIVDRNSLFVGYVYPLTTPSSAYISTLLSHLTRVVHPTIPVDLLPPQFANAPPNKRGSSHDMYAYRVFDLKRGRTGLAGPDDFSLQEDKEDDGERWGGDRVLRVARDEGASDVLVIVSRWYGGELLGPVRFDHIENAARAALQQHMTKEEVDEFKQRIQHLDRKIAVAKAKLQGDEETVGDVQVDKYEDLTMDRAQRLWLARQKALDALQRRVANQSAPPSQTEPQQAQNGAAGPEPNTPADEVEAVSSPSPSESQEVVVKPDPEPSISNPTLTESESAPSTETSPVPHAVKPEPTEPPLPPPGIKHENNSSSPQPTTSTDKQDSKSNIKLEPLENDDRLADLTGWDDLS